MLEERVRALIVLLCQGLNKQVQLGNKLDVTDPNPSSITDRMDIFISLCFLPPSSSLRSDRVPHTSFMKTSNIFDANFILRSFFPGL